MFAFFAKVQGDLDVLGAYTLEGFGLAIDPVQRGLIPAIVDGAAAGSWPTGGRPLHGLELRHDRLCGHQVEMTSARVLEERDDLLATYEAHGAPPDVSRRRPQQSLPTAGLATE
jgi:hypothetical protein